MAQDVPRLAIVDFAGTGQAETILLRQLAAGNFTVVDEGQMQAALRGTGYSGSLNLSRAEARALGMSIGCDYYLLGVMQVLRRAVSAEESYYDGIAGLFTVATTSGRLLCFDFSRTRSESESESRRQLTELIKQSWQKSASAIITDMIRRRSASEVVPPVATEIIELSDSEAAPGMALPVFYQRSKPAYTEQAESLSVNAAVEVEAVFGEDGKVSEAEVVRWAGFGLDEAAVATVRQLRFKPAERDGHPVSLRALVRYNFRRPLSEAEKRAEAEKLKRSLHDVQQQRKPPE